VGGYDDDNNNLLPLPVWRPTPHMLNVVTSFHLGFFWTENPLFLGIKIYIIVCLYLTIVLISIVIPTYNEPNLHLTLEELAKQTVFQKYDTELIIADYDPEHNNVTINSYYKFLALMNKPNIKYDFVPVDRKGIGYARHQGIAASSGQVIVNFDADAKFANVDGLEKLVEPILKNECVMTCCDNLMDGEQIDPKYNYNETMLLVKAAYATTDMIQKDNPVVTLEPGMSFTRYAYDYVGGFNDIKQSEGFFLSLRIIYNFGFNCKKHVPNVTILVSPRRAVASTKFGILDTWFNYDNAFRT
jgi:glycosyltransferase involved in cell wall biosynthesis